MALVALVVLHSLTLLWSKRKQSLIQRPPRVQKDFTLLESVTIKRNWNIPILAPSEKYAYCSLSSQDFLRFFDIRQRKEPLGIFK